LSSLAIAGFSIGFSVWDLSGEAILRLLAFRRKRRQ